MINSFRKDYFFLSNFYETPITYNGITYPSAEVAFQAQKTLDKDEQLKMSLMTSNESKKYGRKLTLRDNWDNIKLGAMSDICRAKFEDPNLRDLLCKTYPHQLIEGNGWHDNFWGSCTCDKCKNEYKYNNLGEILMNIRNEIINEEGD